MSGNERGSRGVRGLERLSTWKGKEGTVTEIGYSDTYVARGCYHPRLRQAFNWLIGRSISAAQS